MSGRQPPAASGRFLHHSKNLKDAVGDELLDKMEKTGKVPSSEKFRRMICFTIVSTGGCPYGDRCVFLHDPRLVIAGFKMKPAKNAKSLSAVKDTFYWPDMARADVSASVDAQGLPNANQPYHIPAAFARALAPGTPGHHLVKTSTGGVRTDGKVHVQPSSSGLTGASRHDRALFSLWGHFVATCQDTGAAAAAATASSRGPRAATTRPTPGPGVGIGRVPTLSLAVLDGTTSNNTSTTAEQEHYYPYPYQPAATPAWGLRGDGITGNGGHSPSPLSPYVAPFVPALLSPAAVAHLNLSPEPSPRLPQPQQPSHSSQPLKSYAMAAAAHTAAPTTNATPATTTTTSGGSSSSSSSSAAMVRRNEMVDGGRRLPVFVALSGGGSSVGSASLMPSAAIPPAPPSSPGPGPGPGPAPQPASLTTFPVLSAKAPARPTVAAPVPVPVPAPAPAAAFAAAWNNGYGQGGKADDDGGDEGGDGLDSLLFEDHPFVTPPGTLGPAKTWGEGEAWGRPFCPPPPPRSEVCARAPTPSMPSHLLQLLQPQTPTPPHQQYQQYQYQNQPQGQTGGQHGDHGSAGVIGPPPSSRLTTTATTTTAKHDPWAVAVAAKAGPGGGGPGEKGSDAPPLLRGLALPVAAVHGAYALWG